MKIVRLCLLLLLVVLLPVRGVMAGAMLCPGADSGSQLQTHLQHGDQSSAQSHAQHAMDEAMMDAHHEHTTSDHSDKCTMCSAFCSLTPLANTIPVAFPALDLASTNFPALATPDPSFLSDGQDRPPRSI